MTTRRQVISKFLWILSAGLIRPAHTLAELGHESSASELPLGMARVFTQKVSAAKVGLEYLRLVPDEADPEVLLELLGSSQELHEASLRILRECLRSEIRRDFEMERTVQVRGWILSRTEARLCALVALLQNPSS